MFNQVEAGELGQTDHRRSTFRAISAKNGSER
jgi:hypothetical protein